MTQVELALTYKCENSLSRRDLLQYIHRNRNNNARRIDTMGIHYKYIDILQLLSFLVNTQMFMPSDIINHSYPGQNMDTQIAEQERKMAEMVKNVEVIQSVVTAHLPWLKALLGNTAARFEDI